MRIEKEQLIKRQGGKCGKKEMEKMMDKEIRWRTQEDRQKEKKVMFLAIRRLVKGVERRIGRKKLVS